MNNSSLDASIPLLTEVIPHQPAGEKTALLPTPSTDTGNDDRTAPETATVPDWDDETWQRMEREVRERVLYQVLERIDFVLEQRVRDSLADVLQTAVEHLASEIRGGLHQTVKEIITRAVSQEITKLQTTKK